MRTKGEQTKQHIRSVAFSLFAEHGYSKVTMQDICTKSGLSKGGLYRHYENKCKIFIDILETMQKEEANREEFGMQQDLSATEILNCYLEHIRENLKKEIPNLNIALYEFCLENKGIGEAVLANQLRKGEAILSELLEYGIARGEFHLTNLPGAVDTILFLVEGMQMVNEGMPIPDQTLENILNKIREIVGMKNEI